MISDEELRFVIEGYGILKEMQRIRQDQLTWAIGFMKREPGNENLEKGCDYFEKRKESNMPLMNPATPRSIDERPHAKL